LENSNAPLKNVSSLPANNPSFLIWFIEFATSLYIVDIDNLVSQMDGRPPVLTATSQSNGNGQTLTTHSIQTP